MGFVWNLAASSGGVANCKQQLTPPLPFERTMGADKALKCYHVFASLLLSYLWGSCVKDLSNRGTVMRPHGMHRLSWGTLNRTN